MVRSIQRYSSQRPRYEDPERRTRHHLYSRPLRHRLAAAIIVDNQCSDIRRREKINFGSMSLYRFANGKIEEDSGSDIISGDDVHGIEGFSTRHARL
jgi:hypothetical protein